MPSVILVDCSLSMLRALPQPKPNVEEEITHFQLASVGINVLLDYLESECKLEFVSLVAFSSTSEILSGFTRDRASVRLALSKVEDFGNANVEKAFSTVSSAYIAEWGMHSPGQVILITDGHLSSMSADILQAKLRLLSFPCQLHVILLSPADNARLKSSVTFYQQLIRCHSDGGEVFVPDGPHLTGSAVAKLCRTLATKCYAPFHATLACGNLTSAINLYPSPQPYDRDLDFVHVHKTVSKRIEVCGFLDIADIANPPTLSRHLVLPLPDEGQMKDEDEEEAGRRPTLSVLMHGSLKVEGMVALVQLAEDWYGMLSSWADNKKKSNLVLSLFEPGTDTLPWLGNIRQLAPLSDFSETPYGEDDSKSPFPVRTIDRRSYTQVGVIWIRPSGLQADVQKVLRSARKLPEKQQQFYKELNRLWKAALSFGFYEVLQTLAHLLERECTMLPDGTHPDAALQLTHVVKFLTSDVARDANQSLLPLRTNFTV